MSTPPSVPSILALLLALGCDPVVPQGEGPSIERSLAISAVPLADGFDFPVGPPDAEGYYDAQPFGGERSHLGSDWNGLGGGDTDLGDPIHAVAHGLVTGAYDHGGGWGGVVTVAHRVVDPASGEERLVESLYAHLDTFDVLVGETVARGQALGSMGNVGGLYLAHLHFEIRTRQGAGLGGGYGHPGGTWVDPTAYIRAHRPE